MLPFLKQKFLKSHSVKLGNLKKSNLANVIVSKDKLILFQLRQNFKYNLKFRLILVVKTFFQIQIVLSVLKGT